MRTVCFLVQEYSQTSICYIQSKFIDGTILSDVFDTELYFTLIKFLHFAMLQNIIFPTLHFTMKFNNVDMKVTLLALQCLIPVPWTESTASKESNASLLMPSGSH